ncbi:MAG: alpha/beta hydrolase, partial [Burkholderiales bacterium]|nr:alpha/beta hydrolase [Burkholderiales bacterium]
GALSLSGIYDLSPIIHTSINGDVRLDEASALKASPAFMPPATEAPLTLAVGSKEIDGFQYQHKLLKERWQSVIADDVVSAGDDHFSILETFANPESDLFKAACRMMNVGTAG